MSMYPIATLSNPTGRIDFTNIPQTFTHLQMRIFGRYSGAAATTNMPIQFNNDVGGNDYYTHWINGDGASATSSSQGPITYGYSFLVGGGSTANVFSSVIIDILDYTNTNKNKTMRMLSGYDANGSGSVRLTSSAWFSTAAINIFSVDIGNYWATGSRIDLYGISTSNATGA